MTQDNYLQQHETDEEKLRTLQAIKEVRSLLEVEAKKKRLQNQLWEKRRQQKLVDGKKVNILFICSRPATWGLLKPACEAFIADTRCNVKVLSIPELGEYGAWSKAEADYGVNCRVIEGYSQYKKEWLDIKLLEPDYIFFQTPYNGHRPLLYHSSIVSTYAKICFTSYGTPVFKGETAAIANPADFLKDVFVTFAQTEHYASHLHDIFNNIPLCDGHIVLSGDARVEAIKKLPQDVESPVWHYPRSDKKFRIVWTPRWTQNGNFSNFWDYKDKILELCRQNQDIELASRPHPLTFSTSILNGYMSRQEVEDYKKHYNTIPNAALDERAEYQDTFTSSDVLLTDMSTIFHDYAATGKPVIYCHREDAFNEHARAVAEGFYWAHNWQEVISLEVIS